MATRFVGCGIWAGGDADGVGCVADLDGHAFSGHAGCSLTDALIFGKKGADHDDFSFIAQPRSPFGPARTVGVAHALAPAQQAAPDVRLTLPARAVPAAEEEPTGVPALKQRYEQMRGELETLLAQPETDMSGVDRLVDDLEFLQLRIKSELGVHGNNPRE